MTNIAVFGGFGNRVLAAGWTKETVIAFFSGGTIDLTDVTPGEDARLTVVTIFGGVDVIVDQGTQITLSGLNFLGSRKVTVTPGAGPPVTVRAVALLGSVEVKPPENPGGVA